MTKRITRPPKKPGPKGRGLIYDDSGQVTGFVGRGAMESPEKLHATVEAYFAQVEADKEPPTISGLALALGLVPGTLAYYLGHANKLEAVVREAEERGGGEVPKLPATLDLLKRAHARVVAWVERQLLIKPQAAGGLIFWLKCQGLWREEPQRVEITGKDGNPLVYNVVHFSVDPGAKPVLDITPTPKALPSKPKKLSKSRP